MRLAKRVRVTPTQYGAVALDERTGQYFQTNTTGALVLEELRRGATTESITNRLVASIDIDYSTAQLDVEAYCQQLGAKGLLQ